MDRRNNDGNYTPANVAWASPREQARNTRANRVIEYKGVKKILTKWAEDLGMKPGTLGARLGYGWSVEEALTTPVEPRAPFSPWVNRGK